jgi:hypothetical protein
MTPERQFLVPVARRCRDVSVSVIAGLWPGRDEEEIEARLSALSLRGQGTVVGSVLGMLFLVSLFAAQFGLLGMALFFLVVVALIA